MKKTINRLFTKLFPSLAVIFKNFQGLASHQGQWRSIRNRMSVDASGSPIPWYTYPAIEYLNNFDFTECDVFEFGSGYSSIYWSKRSRSVVSVEDNQAWYKIVRSNMRSNQILIHRADKAGYVGALIDQNKKFDIIVIDGNHRLSCTVESMKMINEDGIILLDNSDRIVEKECCKLLRSNGFIQIDFSGFGPINGYCWSTSLFLKSPKLFSRNYSGPTPIGGLDN
jgi:hypothetical protein